ncbi:MAG: GntR family transcriptional regulator [Clostridia bacterium]|nr:GntR family transcriptional regulator [Clostridia bacterium]
MSKSNKNLTQPLYDTLLQRIMQGEFSAGDRISENKIAAQFSVSRTVVHTALLRLEQDGLLKMIPRSSPQIATYSADAIKDIGTIRVAIDSLAVKLAMLYGSQADFLELEKFAKECQHGMQMHDEYLQHTADSKFHLHIAKISQSNLLFQFQNDLYLRVNFILLTHHDAIQNRSVHVQDHFDLIQAMLQRDERRAQEIITRHLVSFYNLEETYPPHFFSRYSSPDF